MSDALNGPLDRLAGGSSGRPRGHRPSRAAPLRDEPRTKEYPSDEHSARLTSYAQVADRLVFLVAVGTRRFRRRSLQFADPDRRARLATAFADIDRLFAEFAKTAHVPGAAWGIVIDGELAHPGAAGVRDVAARAPVDADTVFRSRR